MIHIDEKVDSVRIQELRKARGISQRQLAKELEIAPQNLNRYENGISQPDYMMVKAIADYFNVSIEYLLGFSDVSEPLSKVNKDTLSVRELNAVEFYRRLPDKIREAFDDFLIDYEIELTIHPKNSLCNESTVKENIVSLNEDEI